MKAKKLIGIVECSLAGMYFDVISFCYFVGQDNHYFRIKYFFRQISLNRLLRFISRLIRMANLFFDWYVCSGRVLCERLG